ncbi:hypothetical protein SAMN02910369_02133 [Lachnospiraceae bacterium NE2001]|nr:hypothetical protein SAMN02910369_02133 [Lachnospiraceae bacterium NE2001]
MAQKYQIGDTAYIVESNRFIRDVKITKHIAGSYIIKFVDSGGGIRVHESRLFPSEEDANNMLKERAYHNSC